MDDADFMIESSTSPKTQNRLIKLQEKLFYIDYDANKDLICDELHFSFITCNL